jgi:hypothetical protein
MALTRKQKQDAVEAANPLRNAGILKQVFSFLPGHWLFLGAVCKEWNALYSSIGGQQVYSIRLYESSKHMTCESRSTSYSSAVASPETVRLACEHGLAVHDPLQKAAGLYADIDTLTHLRERGMPLNRSVVYGAAISGRLSILQHLLTEEQCAVPNALSYYAARSGNMSMLNWLRAEGKCALDENTCAGAAEGGHLALLKYLRSEGCEWDNEEIAQWAASSGSIEMVEWLRQQQGIVIDAEVLSWAAGTGKTAMCKHLRSTGCDWSVNACKQASMFGSIDTLRWLRESGCPWDATAICKHAAFNGCTDILDFIIEQDEVLDAELLTEALNFAGAYRSLRSAQWLRQHGAQWPAVLAYDAEPNGLLAWNGVTLDWARAEGCISPTTTL